ncbi:hypothetical protein NOM73_22280, partial [Erwinia persicina]|uniref:hypothetical protein n=1 Tax=Erwinia persicina TaxID=55211 RepID=UPI002108C538
RHFFCLLHSKRGREGPSPGVDKTAGPPFCTAAGCPQGERQGCPQGERQGCPQGERQGWRA